MDTYIDNFRIKQLNLILPLVRITISKRKTLEENFSSIKALRDEISDLCAELTRVKASITCYSNFPSDFKIFSADLEAKKKLNSILGELEKRKSSIHNRLQQIHSIIKKLESENNELSIEISIENDLYNSIIGFFDLYKSGFLDKSQLIKEYCLEYLYLFLFCNYKNKNLFIFESLSALSYFKRLLYNYFSINDIESIDYYLHHGNPGEDTFKELFCKFT